MNKRLIYRNNQRETKGKKALRADWIEEESSTTKLTSDLTNKLKHFTYTS